MQLSSTLTWALLLVSAEAKQRSSCKSTKTVWATITETENCASRCQNRPSATASISGPLGSGPAQSSEPTSPGSSFESIYTSEAWSSIALSSDVKPESTIEADTTVTTTPLPSASSLASTTIAEDSTSAPASTPSEDSTPSEAPTSSDDAPSTSASSTTETIPEPTVRPRAYPADVVDKLRDSSIEKLEAHLERNPVPGCTLETAAVRREWSDLTIAERQDYTSAVQCLMTKPAKTPANVASGAKSRYDDFVVTHIQQTGSIHNTANFLTWHRYYTWAYETALRDECGYKGFQPYWNWDRYADDPVNSPLFNGNASSIGGNSVNGDCAETGPFEKLTVNLGPGYSLNYNPRCLRRDVSRSNAQQCTADKTFNLISQSSSIASFQETMQTPWGVHAGGHFTIGGDPGSDFYVSPGDPAFFLHHAMIDRVYWLWQLQDLDTRLSAVAGRVVGSSRQGSLDDDVNLGYSGPGVALGSLLDTMGGKDGAFCYFYM